MNELVKAFAKHLQIDKRVSNNTLQSYERDINKLQKYLVDNEIKILELTEEILAKYISELKVSMTNSSVSRNIASIRAFYRYLYKSGLVSKDVAHKLEAPKVDRKMPEILTKNEVEKILNQPNKNDLKGQRDKAMLELLYATGIKVTELVSLKIDDVNITNGTIKCKKKSKERIIPLGKMAFEYLKEYIKEIRPLLIRTDSEKSLFINTNGKMMTRQGFWKVLKQYTDQSNIDKEITPHTIRHSFAVHLLQSGKDIKSIQEILGHTDIASTQIYSNFIEQA